MVPCVRSRGKLDGLGEFWEKGVCGVSLLIFEKSKRKKRGTNIVVLY